MPADGIEITCEQYSNTEQQSVATAKEEIARGVRIADDSSDDQTITIKLDQSIYTRQAMHNLQDGLDGQRKKIIDFLKRNTDVLRVIFDCSTLDRIQTVLMATFAHANRILVDRQSEKGEERVVALVGVDDVAMETLQRTKLDGIFDVEERRQVSETETI